MSEAKNRKKQMKHDFIDAMRKTLGNISESCKIVGIDRSTYYRWMESDKAFADSIDEVYERNTDFVETKLMKLINEENPTAIIFYLKTKGKKRGYIEAQEIVGNKETPLQITFAEALKGVDTSITDDELKG